MIGGGRPLLRENLEDSDPPLPKRQFSIYFRP